MEEDQIANFQIAVDPVEHLRPHDHVLDLGTAEAVDADRELAGNHGLADHAEQRPTALLEQLAVDLDDEAEGVCVGEAVLPRIPEGELIVLDRPEEGRQVDEERVRAEAA